jgi:hypothetical protein
LKISLLPKQTPRILERLELDGVSVRVFDEEAALLAHFALHHELGFDEEAHAELFALVAHFAPVGQFQNDAPVVAGHLALRVVGAGGLGHHRHLLYGELVPEEVVVHPGVGAAAFFAAEEAAVESFDALEVGGGEGEVEAAVQHVALECVDQKIRRSEN